MGRKKASSFVSRMVRGCWIVAGLAALLLLFGCPIYLGASLWYAETKGPFKNSTQVLDLEGDGDLDVLLSHTRWEAVDISWAGVGMWVNQGDGTFALRRDRGTGSWPFGGFAAAAGDVDQDGDVDIYTQDFGIHLQLNQGGVQGGKRGNYRASGGINAPPAYHQGYRDMGGTITLSDLNGDGRLDAFVAGCCYGRNPRRSGNELTHVPSVSWVWLNDGRQRNLQAGHMIPMDFLDGRPIREVAPGDVDGDGDLDIFVAVGKPTMGSVDSMDDVILLNDGSGKLAPFEQPLGNTDSTAVALGDVNGDGRLDALVGTDDGAKLWMNRSHEMESGGPIFVAAEQSFAAVQTVRGKLQAGLSAAADRVSGLYLPHGSIRTRAVFLADLDRDGALDALLARLWGAEIWWNDGQGSFRRGDQHFEYREDTGVAVADFDGDGDQDIFAGRNEDDYQVWWNDGQGVFESTGR